jgi:hypothetical protein
VFKSVIICFQHEKFNFYQNVLAKLISQQQISRPTVQPSNAVQRRPTPSNHFLGFILLIFIILVFWLDGWTENSDFSKETLKNIYHFHRVIVAGHDLSILVQ